MVKKLTISVLAVGITLLCAVLVTAQGRAVTSSGIMYVRSLLSADGAASTPSMSFASDPSTGFRRSASGTITFDTTGSDAMVFGNNSVGLTLHASSPLQWGSVAVSTPDTALARSGAGKVTLTGTTPMLQLGGTTSSFPALKQSGAALRIRLADDSGDSELVTNNTYSIQSSPTMVTATGVTSQNNGMLRRTLAYTIVTSPAFTCAAVTCDVTIATLPAKTALVAIYADLTTVFACASTCTTSTLSLTLGSSAGAVDILASFDADAAVTTKGLADADLGTAMVRAAAIQGGKLFSFSGTTSLSLRLTSGTGNVGTGAATNLSQGSVTFYIITEKLP